VEVLDVEMNFTLGRNPGTEGDRMGPGADISLLEDDALVRSAPAGRVRSLVWPAT
jgi:hypothetical protein